MENFKVSNTGTTSLFKNPILEKLTRTNFFFPVVLFLVVGLSSAAYGFFYNYSSALVSIVLFVGGIFFFTLIEYVMHRFVFHFNAVTEKEKEIKYKMHGVHHHYPKDKDRLVMPPVISIGLAVVFFGIFWLVSNKGVYAFWGGFLSGYSLYLIIHYSVHRFKQPKNFLSILWKHHSLHHYRSDDSAFGVSNPMWDYIFRTLPPKRSIKKEELESLPDLNKNIA
ncbi:MAG TPA: sterol desaturase family protein [Bacteroidia bacterium]|nr:sterol desaturase family protein [Bacteroidia bacterium]HNU34045.1 sterol desaturase family protein [Bacteroidia bacterium]